MTIATTSRLAYESINDLNNKQTEVLMKIEELQPTTHVLFCRLENQSCLNLKKL